ncbi:MULTISPECIES: hypothetical protein [Chelatococcus]|uniref:phage head-tail joining protein n=1 Tax=Chelatococcus sp. XZ-Ab1 TaxID=3034027 RepID=UPI0012F96A2A|nr:MULTISPECIES: hypothetical protein [Chelatococcus]
MTLRRALATGAHKVRYADGREVTYRSQAEIESMLAKVEDELAGRDRCIVSYAEHSRD